MASTAALDAFFEESVTHLDVIESSLLQLEKEPGSKELIDELFRAAHSMKGNAGLVGFDEIHGIATKMEAMLEVIRTESKTVEQEVRDQLFNHLDEMKGLVGNAKPAVSESVGGEKAAQPDSADKAAPTKPVQRPKAIKKKKKNKDKDKVKRVRHRQAFLTFSLGAEDYGLDIKSVREIIIRRHITRIPNAIPFVIGIMNLRGMVIPVIDAKRKLKFAISKEDTAESVIVVETDGIVTGVLVDHVKGITKFSEDMIIPSSVAFGKVDDNFISGIGKSEKETVMLLDVNSFCDSKEEYF